jgi:hypothetical protein
MIMIFYFQKAMVDTILNINAVDIIKLTII